MGKEIYADWLSCNMAIVITRDYNDPWGIYQRVKRGDMELIDRILKKVIEFPALKGTTMQEIYNDSSALRVAIEVLDFEIERWVRFGKNSKTLK